MVRLATADRCLETVAAFEPSYLTSPLKEDAEGRIAAEAFPQITALAEKATSIFDAQITASLWKKLGKVAGGRLSDLARAADAFQKAAEPTSSW